MIPKKIRICGQDIRVKMVDLISKKENIVGQCKHPEAEILLSRKSFWGKHPRMNPQNLQEHLLHEIIHRVDYKYDVGLREPQVRRLAHGLLQVFQDNKLPFGKRR